MLCNVVPSQSFSNLFALYPPQLFDRISDQSLHIDICTCGTHQNVISHNQKSCLDWITLSEQFTANYWEKFSIIVMLPMPMLKVTGPSGDNVTPNTPANPTVGQANQPAAVAAQQNQQHADSNSYFQQLLSSVQTIDLEEETSPTMVRNLVGGTYCNHDTHTWNWRLNTSAPPPPTPPLKP